MHPLLLVLVLVLVLVLDFQDFSRTRTNKDALLAERIGAATP
jgi:hypothetical protein